MQQEVVERARNGDHDAFAELAGAAITRLDSAAWLILRDPNRPSLTAILNIRFSKTWLINIASGQGEQTEEPVLNFSSWQRLAQPLP
jgi:hypothetical protein